MTPRRPGQSLALRLGAAGIWLSSMACSPPALMTITVSETDQHAVRLQAVPEPNGGKGYSHPILLSTATVARVLTGLQVEEDGGLIPLVFQRSGAGQRSRAFGDAEVTLLAPLLAKGLSMATPEELVTFYETAEISDTQRVVTSGGLYVVGDNLHVILSNRAVKVPIWQDNEEYEAPYRLRPLESISPEPGRLLFEPRDLMAPPDSAARAGLPHSTSRFHVAIKHRKLVK